MNTIWQGFAGKRSNPSIQEGNNTSTLLPWRRNIDTYELASPGPGHHRTIPQMCPVCEAETWRSHSYWALELQSLPRWHSYLSPHLPNQLDSIHSDLQYHAPVRPCAWNFQRPKGNFTRPSIACWVITERKPKCLESLGWVVTEYPTAKGVNIKTLLDGSLWIGAGPKNVVCLLVCYDPYVLRQDNIRTQPQDLRMNMDELWWVFRAVCTLWERSPCSRFLTFWAGLSSATRPTHIIHIGKQTKKE